MDIILPPSLYDILLDAIQFESPEEVVHRVTYNLSLSPEHSQKTKRALSRLLSPIVRLQRHDLLELLFETLVEHGVSVDAMAVKSAVALPLQSATVYLDILFALGWEINAALGNTEPPVLSVALSSLPLVYWLLQKGADPNAACDIDYTPLSVAVKGASIWVVQLMLQYAQHSHNGHLAFYATQRSDTSESTRIIRLLHQHHKPIDETLFQDTKSYRFRGQFLRGTPLYYACKNANLPIALTLLALGANPDKACVRYDEAVGPSPREIATQHGWKDFGR
ncbi:hypothetical protein BST61_g5988 [Cercospora zeina]